MPSVYCRCDRGCIRLLLFQKLAHRTAWNVHLSNDNLQRGNFPFNLRLLRDKLRTASACSREAHFLLGDRDFAELCHVVVQRFRGEFSGIFELGFVPVNQSPGLCQFFDDSLSVSRQLSKVFGGGAILTDRPRGCVGLDPKDHENRECRGCQENPKSKGNHRGPGSFDNRLQGDWYWQCSLKLQSRMVYMSIVRICEGGVNAEISIRMDNQSTSNPGKNVLKSRHYLPRFRNTLPGLGFGGWFLVLQAADLGQGFFGGR